MIRDIIHTLAGLLADAGHPGRIRIQLPPSAFAALWREVRGAEMTTTGPRRTVALYGVEVFE